MLKNYLSILSIIVASLLCFVCCSNSSTNDATNVSIEESMPAVVHDTVRLVVGGDLMQHMPQVAAARTKQGGYDYTKSLRYASPMFRKADVAIINLETTLTRSRSYSGYPCFKSPVELADAMVDMGIDIALLANNHCLDGGAVGLTTTIEELTQRGIAHTGAFNSPEDYAANKILYFEAKGIRFALINYTYGANGFRPSRNQRVNFINNETILQDIASIDRDSVDCLIACMHWGIEYQRHPNAEQIALAQRLRKAGVDIIIGGHPHVVQRYEVDSTGVLFYSLGNFVSNQRKRYTNGGLIAEVEIIRCDTTERLQYNATAHPIYVDMPGYRIIPRSVGDTLTMSKDSRLGYNLFMSDTESLIYGKR